jgi:hypothetical protein
VAALGAVSDARYPSSQISGSLEMIRCAANKTAEIPTAFPFSEDWLWEILFWRYRHFGIYSSCGATGISHRFWHPAIKPTFSLKFHKIYRRKPHDLL